MPSDPAGWRAGRRSCRRVGCGGGRPGTHLLDLATRFDATVLRRLGKRLFEVVCPYAADAAEGRKLADEEHRARRLAHLSLRDNGDGATEGRLRLPATHADLLRKALDALTAPRRIGAARLDPTTERSCPAPPCSGTAWSTCSSTT